MLAKHNHIEFGRVLILGAGATGFSCLRYLHQRCLSLSLADSREQVAGLEEIAHRYPNLPLYRGGFSPNLLDGLDTLVLSPGISRFDPLVLRALDLGIEVVGDVELFARACSAPVIAVTGSNGKSTVTTLVAEMAARAGVKVEAGANLGEPALDLLAKPLPQYYLLELSSFQLETLHSLKAQAVALLNISADHMDRYADLDHYATTKMRIFNNSKLVVLNRDDPYYRQCRTMLTTEQRLITIGLSAPQTAQDYGLVPEPRGLGLYLGERKLLLGGELKLVGRHNLVNLMAAFALADSMSLPEPDSIATAKAFAGLPHRLQLLGTWRQVRWYNDSKATNSAASQSAIEAVADGQTGTIVLIAGGDGKDQNFNDLAENTWRTVRALIVLGKDGRVVANAFSPYLASKQIHILEVDSMDEPVKLAAKLALPGDAVLLAPACSSLDMYRDYRHRGEDFQRAVGDLHRFDKGPSDT